MERCSSCILPTHLPGMDVDLQGRCRYCRQAQEARAPGAAPHKEQARTQFQAIVNRLKGRGKYDCLVPFSGGKESSYLLWALVTQYGLKPLAFNFSNGFQHPDAVRNMEVLADRLGIDVVVYRPSPALLRRLMQTFLLQTGEFCTPCNMLISATAFRLARQNGIQAIMSGNAARTDPGLAGVSSATYYDRVYYLNVAGDILTRAEQEYYLNPGYVRSGLRRTLGMEAQVINVLNYLQPSFQEVHETLASLGWVRPAGAVQHGDCLLDPVKEYLYYQKWGCTEVTALYSLLVRNGEIPRDEALARAQAEEHSHPPAVLPQFLSALGISAADFERASQKDFRDIRNCRNRLTFRCAKKIVTTMEQIRLRGGQLVRSLRRPE